VHEGRVSPERLQTPTRNFLTQPRSTRKNRTVGEKGASNASGRERREEREANPERNHKPPKKEEKIRVFLRKGKKRSLRRMGKYAS